MGYHRLTQLLVAVLLAAPLSGCFYSHEIARTRRDIQHEFPEARFEREVVVRLGPVALRTLGFIAGLVPDEDAQLTQSFLQDINQVKVGVYEAEGLPPFGDFDLGRLRRFRDAGWQVAVKARTDEEVVWVLYRERRQTIRDLYVMVLNEDELVLARIKGRLDRLLARAIAEQDTFVHKIREGL